MANISVIAQAGMDRSRRLAEQYGTPLYAYDGHCLETQYRLLQECLPQRFEILYAVKANPLLGILQLFQRLGSGAEAASEGELYLALRAGFHPRDIIYTCPGKTREGIHMALRNNIGGISIESLDEALQINEMAMREEIGGVPVMVRVNPGAGNTGGALQMSGSTQFGLDEESLDDFFAQLRKDCRRLSVMGVHVYAGTQILDAGRIVEQAGRTIRMALQLSAAYNFPLKCIDLGGGFGVSYAGEPALDVHELKEGFAQLWQRHASALAGVRMIVESGRFLSASSGAFITRVLSVKRTAEKVFVICDGGYSHHPASFHIGRFGGNRFAVEPVHPRGGAKELVTVTGPSGTPVDLLARDIMMEPVCAGDLLCIPNSGAYGFTNSCQYFFSGPSPAEVMYYDGNVQLLRQRGNLKTLLSGMEKMSFNASDEN